LQSREQAFGVDIMNAEAVIKAYYKAIEDHDLTTLDRLYDDEVRLWTNFSDQPIRDKASGMSVHATIGGGSQLSHIVHERYVIGDIVAQRHDVKVMTKSGAEVTIPTAVFITVRDGRIIRIDRYADSAETQKCL
jgi:ketosteroid isomerase-like protein